ncbi:hypothetical protein [Candidatus Paracaedibacter symbiosus]|uniref:hypothetical protein n=1 Tax=Candidatus Paracaedibacter symbiosus TaxID=244582 RepID=UPI0005098035|nr:hypothetical protein [Candidatus Paracaedibacter symbiosus]
MLEGEKLHYMTRERPGEEIEPIRLIILHSFDMEEIRGLSGKIKSVLCFSHTPFNIGPGSFKRMKVG